MTDSGAHGVVTELGLARHPEGGWYRETYRSAATVPAAVLPERFGGDRPCCTAIYFLLEKGDVSAFHRIASDELWHFHAGTELTLHILEPGGGYRMLRLGPDPAAGTAFQALCPAGCWFGAEVTGEGAFSLVGCTVSPGFDFAEFELAERETLLRQYPSRSDLVRRLTRERSR